MNADWGGLARICRRLICVLFLFESRRRALADRRILVMQGGLKGRDGFGGRGVDLPQGQGGADADIAVL